MREEDELTATTCDYLCRAIASGSDYLKSIKMGMVTDHDDHLDVIHVAHESLKEHIHSFGLSGECGPHLVPFDTRVLCAHRHVLVTTSHVYSTFASSVGTTDAWSAPPIHKLQIMTEAYFAEYEAHEQVVKYLHKHLSGGLPDEKGRAVHQRIREECERVRIDWC